MRTSRTIVGAISLTALMAAGAACGSSGKGAATSAPTSAPATSSSAASSSVAPTSAAVTTAPATTSPPTSATASPRYYVSLGDSYASGYQPGTGNTAAGFAYQVAADSKASAHPLQLVNVGCAGATTSSLLNTKGCPPPALGPGASPYNTETQLEAAEAFLRGHPGAVDLITVSIGGNDVTKCGKDPNVAACVGAALTTINTNLPVIAQRLRAAAGPSTVILGTTYPDVILGDWVTGTANGRQLATLSVGAFQSLINPALAKAYATANAQLIDVTAATGAYGPLTTLTNLPPYGMIPVPVARVCELTHYCAQQDIHPNQAGYKVIADLVYGAFVKAHPGG